MNASMPTVKTLEELERLVAPNRYVRFSKGPDDDASAASKDYESDLELPGLSVNPLQPESWWTKPLREWLARQLCNYLHLSEESDRRAWVLAGDVVARGPDNEPLIRDFEPVAWIDDAALREAKAVYEERFDVGEDSSE